MSGPEGADNQAQSGSDSAVGRGAWSIPDSLIERHRRRFAFTVSVVLTIVMVAAFTTLPVPFVKFSPGPLYNVLGNVGEQDAIDISGRRVFATTGDLDLLTVTERGGPIGQLTVPELVAGAGARDDEVVLESSVYPPGTSRDEVLQRSSGMFSASEAAAVAAAMQYLDIPVEASVVVDFVVPESPSEGVLQPGDQIVTIDGQPVADAEDVPQLVRGLAPGDTIPVQIVRGDTEETVELTLGSNPRDPSVPFMGIQVRVEVEPPFSITFNLQGIGGPSAGLVLALGIIDKLTPDNITHGKKVAVTGTVARSGAVGAIGGLPQKIASSRDAGVELLVFPEANCPEVAFANPDGLAMAPVSNLRQAVRIIDSFTAGERTVESLPTCPGADQS